MKKLKLRQQKRFYYTLDASNEPMLEIEPGETIVVETEDAMNGRIRTEEDCLKYMHSEEWHTPGSNPQSGPIYVKGAEKGDTLVIDIKDIKPLIGQGATGINQWWSYTGGLGVAGAAAVAKFFELPRHSYEWRICPIKDDKIHFSDKILIPYKPMIGTIGTALPKTMATKLPGPNGGNMDQAEVCIGNRLYLPIFVKGALLHLGDVHGAQGDGELSGGAIEMPAETTITVDLIKEKAIRWPRIESPTHIMVVCNGRRGLDMSVMLAFIELLLWLEEEFGFDKLEAYALCTQVSKVQLGNLWSVAAKFPKKYL
jgi:amidase